MNSIKTKGAIKLLSSLILLFFLLMVGCSKDEKPTPTIPPQAYVCTQCHNTPDALAVNDGSAKGMYKGIMVGSTGTISINIQNGSPNITATLVIDSQRHCLDINCADNRW